VTNRSKTAKIIKRWHQTPSHWITVNLVGRCDLQVGWVKNKVKNIVYFTYLHRSPLWSGRHQIWFGGKFSGRNQPCQISFQSIQGFWFCSGSNSGLSHRNEVSLFTQDSNYLSACDTAVTDFINFTTQTLKLHHLTFNYLTYLMNKLIYLLRLSRESRPPHPVKQRRTNSTR